jgi:hypothetical protein
MRVGQDTEPPNGKKAGVPHQQVRAAGRDNLRALQKPLARRFFSFKWINRHLPTKRFFGTTENAVKTKIWIAVSV